jgi:hypothetical protein
MAAELGVMNKTYIQRRCSRMVVGLKAKDVVVAAVAAAVAAAELVGPWSTMCQDLASPSPLPDSGRA